jgi:uncharacterized protein involved in outer membrane biogenesis
MSTRVFARRFVKVLFWGLLLLTVLAAGLLWYAHRIDWSQYRSQVGEAVKAVTGRDLNIAGSLQLEILPVPRLQATDLTFSNADGGTSDTMIQAERIGLTLGLRSLLSADFRIKTISLWNTTLLLETDSQGRGNWEFVGEGDGAATVAVLEDLKRFVVEGLDVTWKPYGIEPHRLQIDRAALAAAPLRNAISLDLEGTLDERPVTLEGELTSLIGYLSGRGISGRLTGSSPQVEIRIEGDFGRFPALDGLDMDVRSRGTRWPVILGLWDMPDKETPPWKADFHVATDGRSVRITDLKMILDKSDLAGNLTFTANEGRVLMAGDLTSEFLNISTPEKWWAGKISDDPTPPSSGRVLSEARVQSGWMTLLDTDLNFDVRELKTEDMTATGADMKFHLANGHLEADINASVYGGRATSRTIATAVADAVEYDSQTEVLDADMGHVVEEWLGFDLVEARGSIRYAIAGTGNSVAEIMSGANGELRIAMGEGTARAGVAERAVRGLATTALTSLFAAKKVDNVKMNCFVAQTKIEQGIAKLEVLVLDTENATVFGEGTANLAEETVDMRFKPKPKHVAFNAAVPIHIEGPWKEPEIKAEKLSVLRKIAGGVSLFIFPPAAIAGFGEIGAGDNVCLKLAEESG